MAIHLNATNFVTYGDDTIIVTYGIQNAGSSISVPSGIVTQGENVQITIDDNGLNIDPTFAETWTLTTSTTKYTGGEGTNSGTDIDTTMGNTGFGENLNIGVTDSGSALTSGTTYAFVETGVNTGIFTVHDTVGESTVDTKTDADVDDVVTWTWGGATAQVAVATSTASASLDAGAEWTPTEAAVYTVNDPDMNRNKSDAETLDVQTGVQVHQNQS